MNHSMRQSAIPRAGGPGPPATRRGAGLRASLAGLVLGLALVGTAATRPVQADVYVGFLEPSVTVAPGDTFTAHIVIQQAGAEFNAFDASVRFDPAMLGFEAITPVADQRGSLMTGACSNTFHRFDVAPDSLKITLSLLCNNIFVTGPGTIYRVRFRAGFTEGVTSLSFGPFTEFYRAGLFVRPLSKQGMSVIVGTPVGVGPGPAPGGDLQFGPPAPNPRRGTSAVLLDFTLPAPDVVAIEVLDVQGRRVAARAPERLAGGRHRLSWAPPLLAHGSYRIRVSAARAGVAVRPWTVLR